MDKRSFTSKVDTLVASMSSRIEKLESQKSFYHKRYEEILTYKDDYQRYQFELSRNNYMILRFQKGLPWFCNPSK